jgi:hypothetical protein
MKLAPGIIQYDFSEDFAKSIVQEARSLDIWKKSTLINSKEAHPMRTSEDADFSPPFSNNNLQFVVEYIEGCLDHYTEQYDFCEIKQIEHVGILRYAPGAWYGAHVDTSWQVYRILSMLIYLNPQDYEGGETWFPEFDIKIKPESPSAVIFPSNYIYKHQAMPVASGEKFILVSWMNDLPLHFHARTLDLINRSMNTEYSFQGDK